MDQLGESLGSPNHWFILCFHKLQAHFEQARVKSQQHAVAKTGKLPPLYGTHFSQ